MEIIPSERKYWLTTFRNSVVGLIMTAAITWSLTHFIIPSAKDLLISVSGNKWEKVIHNKEAFNTNCEYRWSYTSDKEVYRIKKLGRYMIYPTLVSSDVLLSEYTTSEMYITSDAKDIMHAPNNIGDKPVSLEQKCSID